MRRGQQFTVMQLLIGAVFAIALLGIAYGVVTSVSEYQPGSDVLSVSGELLASAYSAAGSDEFFHRKAVLQPQLFDEASLKSVSGLPAKTHVFIMCERAFCRVDDEPVTESGKCSYNSGCTDDDVVELVKGAEVNVCAKCASSLKCYLFIGESDCGDLL